MRSLTSPLMIIALMSAGLGALYTWHLVDRQRAVDLALNGYVLHVEAETSKAEASAVIRKMAVLQKTNKDLRQKSDTADQELVDLQKEIQRYEDENPIDSACRASDKFIKRMRDQ